jgi:mannose-6-phosphate isomerase-like protein (cupin superfamily)
MKVNRFGELQAYEADGHFDMRCLRVQGHDASPAKSSWMGISWLLPGGHTTLNPSPLEKMYLVLEGEVVMTNGETDVTLAKHDSCYFAPNEGRQLKNATNVPAAVLLVMPYPNKPWE